MYRWVWFVLGGLLCVTAVSAQSRPRSRMDIERSDDVCSALSPAAKAPVRLSCKDPEQTIPENACRLIAMGRGIGAREAADLCAPASLAKRCADDDTCRQCMSDLERLDWKASARACYALTYVGGHDTRVALKAGRNRAR